MRQRKGWTQTTTARAANVTQGQIARWENGDAWPNVEDLHRLCWCLDASPEEVAALTRHNGGASNGFLLSEESVQGWDYTQWADYLNHLLFQRPPEGLLALTFVGVQERLSQLSEERAFAAALLPNVHAIYARHCLSLGQGRQAAYWSERGLALVKRQLPGLLAENEQTLWFASVLVLATHLGEGGRPADSRRATELLREWLPVMRRGKESRNAGFASSAAAHHAWGRMKLAGYWSKLGYNQEAFALGRAACEEAAQVKPAEGYMRLRDLASLLLEAKEPVSALRTLSQSEALVGIDSVKPKTRAQHYLIEAQCLTAVGAQQSAHERISAAEKIITEQGLSQFQDDLHRAAAPL
jgi:transcriptional regulator with XRE-family HTH domain